MVSIYDNNNNHNNYKRQWMVCMNDSNRISCCC